MEEDLPHDENNSLEDTSTDQNISAGLQVPSAAMDPSAASPPRGHPIPPSGVAIGASETAERPPLVRSAARSTASTSTRSAPPSGASSPGTNHQSLLRQQAHSPVANAPNRGYQRQEQRPPSPAVSIVSSRGGQAGAVIPPRVLHADLHRDGDLHVDLRSLPLNNLSLSLPVPEREMGEDPNVPTTSSGWTHVEPGAGGVPPSARSLHAAALLNGSVYIFGGYSGTERVNSFFVYSMIEKRWCPVLPAANSAPPPSPRDRHVAVAFSNSIYIHGGTCA